MADALGEQKSMCKRGVAGSFLLGSPTSSGTGSGTIRGTGSTLKSYGAPNNQHSGGNNQRGRWDQSCNVVEALPFDLYNVKLDGSGRLTKKTCCHRRHLTYQRQHLERESPPAPEVW